MSELYRLPTGGSRAASTAPTVVAGCVSLFFLSLWAGTQTAAALWHYAPVLGKPMSVPSPHWREILYIVAFCCCVMTGAALVLKSTRGWSIPLGFLGLYCYALSSVPVYAPWQILIWWARFHWTPNTEPIWSAATKAMIVVTVLGVPIIVALAIQKAKRIGGKSDLYGSAEWGTEAQLQKAGLLTGRGLYVGVWQSTRWGRTVVRAIQDDGPEPVLVLGKNRSGKGVGFVIPNALTWGESMIAQDPKSEIWTNSAGYRTQQGHRCLKIDPTATDGSTARWNPLSDMPPPPHDIAFAQTIAQAIMESEEYTRADETAQHFRNTAEDFLRGVLLHVWYAEPNKSLAGCLSLLTNPLITLDQTLERMRTAAHDTSGHWGWIDTAGVPTQTHPVVAAAARAVQNQAPNERTSTVSTAVAFFTLYRDSIIAGNTAESDFHVADLIDPKAAPLSIYITIPTPEMGRLKPFVRILFYQILYYLTAELRNPTLGWAQRSGVGRRVFFLMDEFPMLGNMRLFHNMISVMAGYGIKVLLLAQDISQIYRAYGKEENITGNCRIQIAFAPGRVETAEWVSAKTGVRTVFKQQRTFTGGRFAWYLPHVIASEQEVKRELMTRDEAMRLPDSMQLLFVDGVTFLCRKIRHYEDTEMLRRSLIPPPSPSPPEAKTVYTLEPDDDDNWLDGVQS